MLKDRHHEYLQAMDAGSMYAPMAHSLSMQAIQHHREPVNGKWNSTKTDIEGCCPH
jgi:hypothetical protein